MNVVNVNANGAYEIVLGNQTLSTIGARIKEKTRASRVALFSDSEVAPLYLERVAKAISAVGLTPVMLPAMPAGEAHKTPETLLALLNDLTQAGLTRHDVLVAVGGGVVGDVGALGAALYLRGIRAVQVPTSLLAIVDSSVGGKTAVNLPAGKNLMGTFTQPLDVVVDPTLLKTLPEAYWADGWAELIKYAELGEREIRTLLNDPLDEARFLTLLTRAVEKKRDIVEADPLEKGERKLLNFGHTVGHALERLTDYQLSHGRAVAIGMRLVTKAAVKAGLCPEKRLVALEALLARYGLTDNVPVTLAAVMACFQQDKKRTATGLDLIVPVGEDGCEVRPYSWAALDAFLAPAFNGSPA